MQHEQRNTNHNDAAITPSRDEIVTALQAFSRAASQEEARSILEDQQKILLSDNTLAVLYLFIVRHYLNGDTEAAESLEHYLFLLETARLHGLEAAWQYLLSEQSENLEELDVSRIIELLTLALEYIERDEDSLLWAELHKKRGDSYTLKLLENQLEYIEQTIADYDAALEVFTHEETPLPWAQAWINRGLTYMHRIQGDHAANIEYAIANFNVVLEACNKEEIPSEWGICHLNRGLAYINRIQGERKENLEQAIFDFDLSLEVCTYETTPREWALTHLNRGFIHMNLARDEQGENLEQATADFNVALTYYTYEHSPLEWAELHFYRGRVYWQRIQGEKAENLEQAIAAFNAALTVYTHEDLPYAWAETCDLRGRAYWQRLQGERTENIEQAIADYSAALSVFTYEETPQLWAEIHHNRGIAYVARISGKRMENLEHALADFDAALKVYTHEETPSEWASTHLSRGNIYAERIQADRAENIEHAITDPNAVLTVYTLESQPFNWAQAMQIRGFTYSVRVMGDQAQNSEQSIADLNAALSIFTREHTPLEWAQAMANRGKAYLRNQTGNQEQNQVQAIADLNAALSILTFEHTPLEWAWAIFSRGCAHGNPLLASHKQNIEQAIADFDAALSVFTREKMPVEWAQAIFNRGQAYSGRSLGNSRQNAEQAIADFDAALSVLTRENRPLDWATNLSNRGNAYFFRFAYHGGLKNRRDDLEQAIADYNIVLEVISQETDPTEWARILNNRAGAYTRLYIESQQNSHAKQALADFDSIMSIFSREATPDKYRNIQLARWLVLIQKRQWAEAHNALLEARRAQRDVIETSTSEASRSTFIAEPAFIDIYLHDAIAILQLDRPDLAEVAIALEEGRAQSLRAALDLDTIVLEHMSNSAALVRAEAFIKARDTWRQQQREMFELLPLGISSVEAIKYKEHRTQALLDAYHAFVQARDRIRKDDNPDFMAPVPTIDGIARAISSSDEALVYLAATEGNGIGLVITGTKGTVQIQQVSLPYFTLKAIDNLLETNPTHHMQIKLKESLSTLGKLGLNELVRVLQYTRGIRKVKLVTYGRLGLFPLSAVLIHLSDGSKRWLGDIFEITFVPSARAAEIAHERTKIKHRRKLLTAGNPLPLPRGVVGLPFAEAEADTIRRIAKAYNYLSVDILCLRLKTATREQVIRGLEQARYAHLALHGQYNVDAPQQSRLILAGNEHVPEAERNIYLSEVLDGTINLVGLRLLVLSACETARIDIRKAPNEVLGLAAGFLQAGAAGVIASLWPVADCATYLLMSRFAQLYLDPQGLWSPARALAEAQRWLREEATNEVLRTYNPTQQVSITSESRIRSIHNIRSQALDKIKRKASSAAPDALPYADPIYWAAFVVTGC